MAWLVAVGVAVLAVLGVPLDGCVVGGRLVGIMADTSFPSFRLLRQAFSDFRQTLDAWRETGSLEMNPHRGIGIGIGISADIQEWRSDRLIQTS